MVSALYELTGISGFSLHKRRKHDVYSNGQSSYCLDYAVMYFMKS